MRRLLRSPAARSSEPPEAVDEGGGQDAGREEAEGRLEARALEVRDAEDPVSARAAPRHARTEADEQAPGEHPRELARRAQADDRGEDPEVPEGLPAAARRRREEAPEHEPGEEGEPPAARARDLAAPQVGRMDRERAEVLEAGRDAEALVGEEEEEQRDGANRRAGHRPGPGLEVMQEEHGVPPLR